MDKDVYVLIWFSMENGSLHGYFRGGGSIFLYEQAAYVLAAMPPQLVYYGLGGG